MKQLILLRHAKSDRDNPALADKDRPLADRGRHAAPLMGAWIASEHLAPSRVLVSTAVRTRQTWALAAPFLTAPHDVDLRDDLYHAEAQSLLGVIRRVGEDTRSVMLVGHNPGLEDLATQLAGSGNKAMRNAMAAKFPSGACAVLTFESARWKELQPGTGRLLAFMTPRQLDDGL